jgi:hypothetical protein
MGTTRAGNEVCMNSIEAEYDKVHKARIQEEYDFIVSKLKDGKMFGHVIDLANDKELVVAAYFYAKSEEARERAERYKNL